MNCLARIATQNQLARIFIPIYYRQFYPVTLTLLSCPMADHMIDDNFLLRLLFVKSITFSHVMGIRKYDLAAHYIALLMSYFACVLTSATVWLHS